MLLKTILNYLRGKSGKFQDEVKVMVIVPPDGGFSWFIVFASFYISFVLDGCLFSFSVIMQPIQDLLGVSSTEVAFVGSMFQGLYYFSGPFTSLCVNNIGFRLTSIMGSMCLSIGFLSAAYFRNYVGFLFMYGVLGGCGAGLCYTPSIIIVSYHFERYRALATGLAMSGSAVGAICLSILFEVLIEQYGLYITLLVHAGFGASTLVSALIYRYPPATEVVIDEMSNNLFGTLLEDKDENEDFRHLLRKSILGSNLDDKLLRSAISRTNFGERYRAVMNQSDDSVQLNSSTCWPSCCRRRRSDSKRDKKITTRPLDRQDIFLGQSMADFSEIPQPTEISPKPMKKSFCKELVNPALFKSKPYIFAVLALITYTLAVSTPYMYTVDRAVLNGMPIDTAKMLLPFISVGNMVGRLLSGVVSFWPGINSRYLVTVTLVSVGAINIASAFLSTNNVDVQYIMSFLTGLFLAFSPTLRTISYVYYIGMDLLTSAFGIGLMFAGIAALTGTPFAGYLKQATGSYVSSFVFSGVSQLLSALFTLVAELIYQRSKPV